MYGRKIFKELNLSYLEQFIKFLLEREFLLKLKLKIYIISYARSSLGKMLNVKWNHSHHSFNTAYFRLSFITSFAALSWQYVGE